MLQIKEKKVGIVTVTKKGKPRFADAAFDFIHRLTKNQ